MSGDEVSNRFLIDGLSPEIRLSVPFNVCLY